MHGPPDARSLNRRAAIKVGVALAGGIPRLGALSTDAPLQEPARLKARPGDPTLKAFAGRQQINTDGAQALAWVPESVKRDVASPLVLFLHGALRRPEIYLEQHISMADETGTIVLAPFSTIGTWDAIRGAFGRDIGVIDASLRWVFERWRIDPRRIVISGFSDGGSYGLSVGVANGDFFTRIVAWSPGFMIPVKTIGKPPVLISHGTEDQILPIDRTSRQIVPALRAAGYTVDYREFKGPHAIQKPILEEMIRELAGRR
ncbi:MAG: dienelactone hydrolase family protein [Cytophagaceae bacterium]|nr:dienelactone hydrolase family protein [Gemmatimonadaceae bacterium]